MREPPDLLDQVIPTLRPYVRQGDNYRRELRRLEVRHGADLVAAFTGLSPAERTAKAIVRLALSYRLQIHTTCSIMAKAGVIPATTYATICATRDPVRVIKSYIASYGLPASLVKES